MDREEALLQGARGRPGGDDRRRQALWRRMEMDQAGAGASSWGTATVGVEWPDHAQDLPLRGMAAWTELSLWGGVQPGLQGEQHAEAAAGEQEQASLGNVAVLSVVRQ